ncbi:Adenylyltransferase and sulfurtransferase MOCS3-2 [Dichanthelium oligosanthes]|uniref:Adenylyltransferase and sulfurtransferase MOCS3-2 n=1 Tax=Dichanthelium oligosanthes TaxID=888268 RepID=A0A1E5WA00_9POAL|nr:Adenylyltransferase and sulfurtransferase MOCS3-2 [Dichanthelium oligosanthes]
MAGGGGCGRSREAIEGELRKLRAEREELDSRIRQLESQLEVGSTGVGGAVAAKGAVDSSCDGSVACRSRGGNGFAPDSGLPADMIYRYSRHLLLPDFGVEGQRKLSHSSILVVGAGGLGSPVALYLAACGVGCLGIVDGDDVELNNLHRQIIHKEAYVGQPKVKSAADACREYDIVVDATDNLPTRYMISDCCVLLNKPLVSGAALGLEGQLTVYHHNGSPCYRCLFPSPPPVAACQRCSDSGVLGVKLRGSLPDCTICGKNSVFTEQDFQKFDYESFTQSPMSDKTAPSVNLLPESARITSRDYKRLVDNGEPHLLLDVRPTHHFQIASISPSLNIPLSMLEEKLPMLETSLKETGAASASGKEPSLVVLCRRGNDSQIAVKLLLEKGFASAKDIIGGLQAWGQDVDPDFPVY